VEIKVTSGVICHPIILVFQANMCILLWKTVNALWPRVLLRPPSYNTNWRLIHWFDCRPTVHICVDDTDMYGCQPWSSVFQYSLGKLKTAHDDGIRLLLNEPRWRNATSLFVYYNAPHWMLLFVKYYLQIVALVSTALILFFQIFSRTFSFSLICLNAGAYCHTIAF